MKMVLVKDGKVVNICNNTDPDWIPPDGQTMIDYVEGANIGMDVIDGVVQIPVKSQAELDAEEDASLQRIADKIDRPDIIKALATEVFKLAKAAEPSLTPAQFKQRLKNNINA